MLAVKLVGYVSLSGRAAVPTGAVRTCSRSSTPRGAPRRASTLSATERSPKGRYGSEASSCRRAARGQHKQRGRADTDTVWPSSDNDSKSGRLNQWSRQ